MDAPVAGTLPSAAGRGAHNSEKEPACPMREENALLRQAQAFEQDALARIHDAYYGAIYRYISFHVDDLQTVADLTSEVFTRFLAALRKRSGRPNSVRPWLYGTASRVVKEYYRSRRRRNVVTLDESLAVEQMGPEQSTEEMWVQRQLREAIQGLTEDQKMVLALRFGENLPIREVATRMNKSEGAVKMLRARAVSALACQMVERK